VLSETGWRQSRALGHALKRQGTAPAALVRGAQRRHRETLEGLAEGLGAEAGAATVETGLNEFDFRGLLEARFRGRPKPEGLHGDRKTHFRILRDTVLEWQRDDIVDPPEPFAAFAARVRSALDRMAAAEGPVLAVSSGGPIAFLVAAAVEAPAAQMIRLQLQMRNCGVSRLIVGRSGVHLHGFNETPHVYAETAPSLLTYS
jgi:broad specificity phosphatase PhoE